MTLGDMIADWQDEATLINALIDLDDLPLLARLQQAADQDGCDLADFVRHGVGRFVAEANDEAWLTLIGRINKAEDPAKTGLKLMIEFGLADRNPA